MIVHIFCVFAIRKVILRQYLFRTSAHLLSHVLLQGIDRNESAPNFIQIARDPFDFDTHLQLGPKHLPTPPFGRCQQVGGAYCNMPRSPIVSSFGSNGDAPPHVKALLFCCPVQQITVHIRQNDLKQNSSNSCVGSCEVENLSLVWKGLK